MVLLGIGPKLVLFTLLYSFLLKLGIKHYNFDITLMVVPYFILIIVGILLIITGIFLLIKSLIVIRKLYKVDILYTKNIYSLCRHPLYASWIIFIVPGIVILLNSLLLLTIPFVMYFIFRLLVKGEENLLIKKYGVQYLEYKNQVGLLFPKFWKFKKEN